MLLLHLLLCLCCSCLLCHPHKSRNGYQHHQDQKSIDANAGDSSAKNALLAILLHAEKCNNAENKPGEDEQSGNATENDSRCSTASNCLLPKYPDTEANKGRDETKQGCLLRKGICWWRRPNYGRRCLGRDWWWCVHISCVRVTPNVPTLSRGRRRPSSECNNCIQYSSLNQNLKVQWPSVPAFC